MPTPLEKAKEIFDRIYDLEGKAISKIDAYKLSIICVEEVIDAILDADKLEHFDFWNKVKKHLKNKSV